jgi:hypothetical protein
MGHKCVNLHLFESINSLLPFYSYLSQKTPQTAVPAIRLKKFHSTHSI